MDSQLITNYLGDTRGTRMIMWNSTRYAHITSLQDRSRADATRSADGTAPYMATLPLGICVAHAGYQSEDHCHAENPLDEGSVTMSTKRGSRQAARCRYVSRTVVVAYDIEVGDAANAVVKVLTIHR